jgi:hypothetical protein
MLHLNFKNFIYSVSKRKKLTRVYKPKELQSFKKQTLQTLNIQRLRRFFYDV